MSYGEPSYGESTYGGDDLSTVSTWIEMAGATGDAVAYGPGYFTDPAGDVILGPGSAAPAMALEVVSRATPGTVLSTLGDTFARSFLDEKNDTGSGSLAYANTDTAAAAALVLDRLVTFLVHGVRAFTMLIESKHRVTVTDAEEHGQVCTVIGRGHLAVMEEAVLYPSRGTGVLPIEEDRTFNWSSPSTVFDDSGWGYAIELCDIATAQVIWPLLPFAQGWPDGDTGLIWAPGSTTQPAPGGAPAGPCYFRKDFSAPSDGVYLFYAAIDNHGEIWLDGQKILDVSDYRQSFTYEVVMTAGAHTMAVYGVNEDWGFGSGQGPGAFSLAIYTINSSGGPDTRILETDATWKIVAYPPFPPGMLVGEAIHVAFAEAVARGVLTDVTLMFTETHDSAGAQWPETLDIATKVGTTMLTFLFELTASYIDVWMKPGTLELYAWRRNTRQRLAGITLHDPTDVNDPTSGNMFEQTHTVLG